MLRRCDRDIFLPSKTRQITIKDKLRYAFDKSMAAGPIALIGWLTLISLAFILLAAIVLTVTGIRPEGEENLSFDEASWAKSQPAGSFKGPDTSRSFRIFAGLKMQDRSPRSQTHPPKP